MIKDILNIEDLYGIDGVVSIGFDKESKRIFVSVLDETVCDLVPDSLEEYSIVKQVTGEIIPL